MWCFDHCFKYICKESFYITAIQGTSFYPSAKVLLNYYNCISILNITLELLKFIQPWFCLTVYCTLVGVYFGFFESFTCWRIRSYWKCICFIRKTHCLFNNLLYLLVSTKRGKYCSIAHAF
jgi:hypothetical protein